MYRPPLAYCWSGRKGMPENTCLFQRIQLIDLEEDALPVLSGEQRGIAFMGFASDEGVRRNQGRVGAMEGPEAFRKALSGIAGQIGDHAIFLDCGDVACTDGNLDEAQRELGAHVKKLLDAGYHPILLGGGHSIALGNYLGLESHTGGKKLGIINIDAHYDLRSYDYEANSGTPFRQIADRRREQGKPFSYLCIGIQEHANSRALFETAEALGVETIAGEEVHLALLPELRRRLQDYLSGTDVIYLTVCLDVFAAAYAPGVSAPAHIGIEPAVAAAIIDIIVGSGKVVSCDLAELNPTYDTDNQTARLASALVYRMIRGMVQY